MDLADIVGEAVEHVLTYTGGNTRRVYVTPIETPYPHGKLIVSRTDTRGIMTQCNPSFVEMSGYSEAELIGQPHCLLRHPDMPAAAFRDLWETVEAGRQWHGYVKNLRKDGGHYWVYATVVPNVREGRIVGFTSVRREPSREKVALAEAQYQEMRRS
ncbi:MAG: PAS domain-containing protein [Zoogloea sp.]|uniref:PAS domain-containing protein n=1 Tax=Zoogloea sp. TaxID=49181 RepID=UPI0026041A73|nr:PAS domain-containing protein [Zoogloea sp.]MDD3327714.1 PAS domain-containing protein [Zoogloea sp.]